MKLSENFSSSEFECKCGCKMPNDVYFNITKLANQLQILRNKIKSSISITSGYRCESHNKAISGAKNSKHILGKAVDIKVAGMQPKKVYNIIEELISEGVMLQGGLGLYKTWVHYDIRKTKARW